MFAGFITLGIATGAMPLGDVVQGDDVPTTRGIVEGRVKQKTNCYTISVGHAIIASELCGRACNTACGLDADGLECLPGATGRSCSYSYFCVVSPFSKTISEVLEARAIRIKCLTVCAGDLSSSAASCSSFSRSCGLNRMPT